MRAKTMHERLIEKHGMLPLVVLALSLTGCAVSREVRTADGWINHVVSCGGPFLNMGHCLERAGRVCAGRGYQVLNKVGGELPNQPHAMPTGGAPDIPASFSQLKQYPGRKLLIRCN
jgi:hypothetical protein